MDIERVQGIQVGTERWEQQEYGSAPGYDKALELPLLTSNSQRFILQFTRASPLPTPSTMKTFVATVALVAAASMQDAQAHTYLTQPLAEFKSGASKSSWVAEFSPPWSGTFKTGAQYAAVAPGKGYKTLRSFLESKGATCGNTLSTAKAKSIPSDSKVKFASTLEHPGPCEIWLDDTRAYHNDDCEKTLGSATSLKVDFSSCKTSCMLRFYWLGLQDSGTRWQSYKNCVPLSGKSRSLDDEEEYTFADLNSTRRA
jgi:hypothetical protein